MKKGVQRREFKDGLWWRKFEKSVCRGECVRKKICRSSSEEEGLK